MALSIRSLTPSLLLYLPLSASAITWSQAPPQKPANVSEIKPSPGPVRIRTDIESFHLDRQAGAARNQIGASSRGGQATLVLCAPHSGLTSTTHPVFVWQLPSTSPGPVHFSLVNPSGDVLFETEVTGTHFEYAEDAPPLAPGGTFAWTVSGHGGTDKLPTYVEFEVQAKAERDALLKQLAESSPDPLARAQVFLSHQAWYDAIAELQTGLKRTPGRQDLTQQLQALYRQIAPSCANP